MNSAPVRDETNVREEAFNTKLAQLLSESGTLHIPESISIITGHKPSPDIFAEYWGVRVVLEARFVKNKQEKPSIYGV